MAQPLPHLHCTSRMVLLRRSGSVEVPLGLRTKSATSGWRRLLDCPREATCLQTGRLVDYGTAPATAALHVECAVATLQAAGLRGAVTHGPRARCLKA